MASFSVCGGVLLTFGALLDETIRLYRRGILAFVGLTAVAFAPFLALSVAFVVLDVEGSDTAPFFALGTGATYLGCLALANLAVMAAIRQMLEGQPIAPVRCFLAGLGRLPVFVLSG